MKKVLIAYTSIGSGHRVVGEAVRDALLRSGTVEVKMVDTFAVLGRAGRVLADVGSFLSLSLLPNVYDLTWNSPYLGQIFAQMPKSRRVEAYLLSVYTEYQPDVIVCTHALPCTIFCRAREGNRLSAPVISVSADMQIHPYWPLTQVDHYMVGSDSARTRLLEWGVASERISVVGIPIRGQFAEQVNTGMKQGRTPRQILILAGGRQAAPYALIWPHIVSLIFRVALTHNLDFQWTVITGCNSLLERLLKRIAGENPSITIVGYVEKMADLLTAADVVITKPGGSILAESLALHKPLILLSRGAGQEAANAEYLIRYEAALLSEHAAETLNIVTWMFVNGRAERMAQNAAALAYPQAANQVANYVFNLLGETSVTPVKVVTGNGVNVGRFVLQH